MRDAMAETRRRLAAILAADVAGYSRLMGDDEAATLAALNASREIFRGQIEEHSGRLVDTAGDSVLAVFDSVVEAARCAAAAQTALIKSAAAVPEDRRMRFRIGVNLGDIIEQDDGTVYGEGVNVAARLEGLADPGGIAISGAAHMHLRNKIDLAFEDIGEHQVKNISEPVPVYRVSLGVTPNSSPETLIPETGESDASIAVLPFDNRSSDPEQAYFAEGIAEDLITELSHVDGLLVFARNSSFKFKSADIDEIGHRLGARYVVDGSVRRSGQRVRISAQLTDIRARRNLWAERYDRDLTDVFAVQDDVTAHIVSALNAELDKARRSDARRKLTDNVEAFDLYMRGRAYVERTTPDANRRAREFLRRAITIDPKFAAAYAELAMVKFRDWIFGWDPAPNLLEQALDDAKAAVTYDNMLAAAHIRFAWITAWLGDHDSAILTARRAVELDRNYAEGHALLAGVLAFAGEGAAAVSSGISAARLDPFSFTAMFHQCVGHFVSDEFELAIDTGRKTLRLNPDFLAGHLILTALLGLTGSKDEAENEADEVRRLMPDLSPLIGRLPFREPERMGRLVEGLRKAGLEFTYGSDPSE